MKININSNHIRIYKLLGYLQDDNIDFLSKFLNMDKQNINLYVKQINSFINFEKSKKEDILQLLKKHQCFTKENRILYIIVLLLRDRHLNLNNLSDILSISRRALSNDLSIVKEHLEIYNLEVNSTSAKGISLSGDDDNIKSAGLSYLYKVLIEFEDLPDLIRTDFTEFLGEKLLIKLDKDIEHFLSEYNFDFFPQNKHLLKSFIIIYGNLAIPKEPTIASMNFSNFKEAFRDVVPTCKLKSSYNFIKKSFVGIILMNNLNLFIQTLKFCNGILKDKEEIIEPIDTDFKNSLIFKTLSSSTKKIFFLERFSNKTKLSNYKSKTLSICDLEFLNLNLSQKDRVKCVRLFYELKKFYNNIQLSNIILFYIWNSYEESLNNVKNTLVVFDSIPTFLFPVIKKVFFLKENMNILKFIRPYELENHLSNSNISCIITFENINIDSKYDFIKLYPLPTL